MTLAEKQRQLTEDLSIVPDRNERLALVIDRSRRLARLPPAEKNPSTLVPGCVSPVWLVGESQDGRVLFRSDAESPMVRGLVALMCELYDRGTPAEIAVIEPAIFEELGLLQNLSPTRRNGLDAVRKRIRTIALDLI